jgi:hypothetical protein
MPGKCRMTNPHFSPKESTANTVLERGCGADQPQHTHKSDLLRLVEDDRAAVRETRRARSFWMDCRTSRRERAWCFVIRSPSIIPRRRVRTPRSRLLWDDRGRARRARTGAGPPRSRCRRYKRPGGSPPRAPAMPALGLTPNLKLAHGRPALNFQPTAWRSSCNPSSTTRPARISTGSAALPAR